MNCPICHVTLQIAERQGIEIDYCPQCRGIWLDRGELDKLLDHAATAPPPRYEAAGSDQPVGYRPGRPPADDDSGEYRYDPRPRRRKSFLSELFDFD